MAGTLDNGLAYFLRSNGVPGGSLELRLVVNAGSLQQDDPAAGTAHFLEHMLFNGTSSFPGNELDRALTALGIEFGTDSNAFTSQNETVYHLNVPTTVQSAVTTAFLVMAEWASAATLDPGEVQAEIGVVRDELRQAVESPSGYVSAEFDHVYTNGTLYENRAVLGRAKAIEATEAASLRSYYDEWYRPDNMAIVAVGDFGVDALEDLVHEYFADLEARGNDRQDAAPVDIEPNSEATAFTVTHPGILSDNLSIDFQLTAWDDGTVGGTELGTWEHLIVTMISGRLADSYHSGAIELDFEPDLEAFDIARGLRFVGSNLRGPDLTEALRAYLGVVRGATSGFTSDEVAEAVRSYEAELDDWEASLGSSQNADYADSYVMHFLEGYGAEAQVEALRREREILDRVAPSDLTKHWAWILDNGGPILIAVGAEASTLPTVSEMLEVADTAVATAAAETAESIDTLMAAPDPVDPASVEILGFEDPANGPQLMTFANGASVVFQESAIQEGRVRIYAESLGGYSIYNENGAILTGLATYAVSSSGLGDLTRGQVDDYLADKVTAIEPFIFRDVQVLSGYASTDDIETAFQLIHLLVTEPRIDPAGLNTALAIGEEMIEAEENEAETQAGIEFDRLLYEGDFANWIPTQAQLDSATAEDLLEVYRDRFDDVGDLIVSVVGEADRAEVGRLARTYIATLPEGQAETFVDRLGDPPSAVRTSRVVLPEGTGTGGITMLWQRQREWDTDDAMTALILEVIVNQWIYEEIREELGASYSGEASITLSTVPDSRISALLEIRGDPTRLDEIRVAVLRELRKLAESGPDVDDFDRAVAVVEENFKYIDNGLLGTQNLEITRDPDSRIVTTANRHEALRWVSTETVRDLVAELFDPRAYIEVARVAG